MSDILEKAKERAAFYRDYTRLGARFDPDTGTEAADLIERLAAELAKAREALMSLRSRLDHHMGDTDPSDPSDPDLVAMQKASEALAAKGADQ